MLNNPTKYTDPSGEVIRGGGPLPAHQGYSMYTESPVVSYDGFVISGMEAGSFLESLSRGGGAAHGLGVISNGNITHTRENKSAIASLNPTAFMDFLYPNGFMNNSKNIFNKLYNRFYTNEILDNNAQIPYRLGTEIVREKVEKNENEQSGGNPSLGSQIVNNVLTGAGAFSATMEASYASDAQYIYRYAQGSQSATQITQANKVLSNRIAGGFQVAGQAIAVLSLSHSAIQSYNGNARNGSFVYDVINTGIGFIPFVGVPTSILGAVYKDDILDYGNSHPYHGNAHTRCFVAGTPVYSNDGFVNIELLKVNDTLSSYNVATGVVELMQVSHTSNRITTNVYQVVTNLDTFIVTGEHPFYVEGRNWTEVKDLKAGDELRSLLNTKISVIKIEKLEVEKTVYNIEVNGNHNFYVGQGKVLVHNKTRNEKHISTEELNKKILIQKDILDETRNKK